MESAVAVSDAAARALEREVFERVFGYRAGRGVKVPRFTEDHEMMEAVISHIHEAWKPQKFRIDSTIAQRGKEAGEWNTYEIVCKGKTVSLWVNGAVTSNTFARFGTSWATGGIVRR